MKLFPRIICLLCYLCRPLPCTAASQDIVLPSPIGSADAELSGLLPIQNPALLKTGWTLGFWTILDEPPVERAIVRLGCTNTPTSSSKGTWQIEIMPTKLAKKPGLTNDCEALARRGGRIYIFGSHFGGKKGPLELQRQFVARFEDQASSATGLPNAGSFMGELPIEVAEDDFKLYRVINDALTSSGLKLIERGAGETEKYIDKSLTKYAALDLIRPGDRAINIEGAAFLPSGNVLLGLRYPVTRDGHPILIELSGIERLFQGGEPHVESCRAVQNVGDASLPSGVRDMFAIGNQIHVLAGNLDRLSHKKAQSVLLDDHPNGIRAPSRHYVLTWPGTATDGKPLEAKLVRDLAPRINAEGLAADAQGRFYYVFDEKNARLQFGDSPVH